MFTYAILMMNAISTAKIELSVEKALSDQDYRHMPKILADKCLQMNSKDTTRQAHDVNTTSRQRRCNVMTLHRR